MNCGPGWGNLPRGQWKSLLIKRFSTLVTNLATFLKVTALCCLLPACLSTGMAGDFTYTTSGGEATITGYTGAGGAVTIPSTIDGLPVTRIGNSAFYCLSGPSSVTIPQGVVSIGTSAFAACPNLTTVTLPTTMTSIGDRAFYYCAKLTTANLPQGLLTLGNGVFEDCPALKGITVPASVTTMGTGMFKRCKALETAHILASVSGISEGTLQDCTALTTVTLPSGLTSLPNYLFYNCSKLPTVTIPSGATSIGYSAFQNCTALSSITLPAAVATIGDRAFLNCTSLANVAFNGPVETVGFEAFRGCAKLKAADFNPGLKTIGESAFFGCTALASLQLPVGLTSIGQSAFSSCSSLTQITIPASVTTIGPTAFGRCTGVQTITVDAANPNYLSANGVLYNKTMTQLLAYPGGKSGAFAIPETVTSIEAMAFGSCGSLTAVTIPQGVTTIGDDAFSHCPKLVHITIPASMQAIGLNAFAYSANLATVVFSGAAPWTGIGAFDGTKPGFTIFYQPGAAGFTTPLWRDYPTLPLEPGREILVKGPLSESLPGTGATIDFGYHLPGSTATRSITVINAGSENLALQSAALSGAAATDFNLGSPPAAVLPPGMSAAIAVTFTAGTGGSRSALLQLISDDADENPFEIHLTAVCTPTPVPEITVFATYNGISLRDGVSTLGAGIAEVNTVVYTGVTIRNSGTGNMSGLSSRIDGANAAEFTISAQPPATLAPGQSFSFSIGFSPKAVGDRTAQLHITSNDADENPFDLNLLAVGKPVPTPEISVEPPTGPAFADGVSIIAFDSQPSGTKSATRTYTVRNTGTAPLYNLALRKSGPNANEFIIGTSGSWKTSLLAGESATFNLTFWPSATGTKTASLFIDSNDADENPFDIQLYGVSSTAPQLPEISVTMGSSFFNDGTGTVSFGATETDEPVQRVLSINNTGSAALTDLAVMIDGTHPEDFTVNGPALTTLLPGTSTTIAITFSPTATGSRSAALHLTSNDADESPFDINLDGYATEPTFPDIVVEAPPSVSLVSGLTPLGFGTVPFGSHVLKTLTIRNEGNAPLKVLSGVITGPDSSLFTLGALPSGEIAVGQSAEFTLAFRAGRNGNPAASLSLACNDPDENPFIIPLSAIVPALVPDIEIQQPAGKALKDGFSACQFGTVAIKATANRVFTIRNRGQGNLNLKPLAKAGPHAGDFIVQPMPLTVLKPGEIRKFTVVFKPSAKGIRKAVIRLASNDPDESPFDINLTGTGASSRSAPLIASTAARDNNPISQRTFTVHSGIDGAEYLMMEIRKTAGQAAQGVVEVSNNLIDWHSGTRHTTVVHDGPTSLLVRDNTPVRPGQKRYIRFRPPASSPLKAKSG